MVCHFHCCCSVVVVSFFTIPAGLECGLVYINFGDVNISLDSHITVLYFGIGLFYCPLLQMQNFLLKEERKLFEVHGMSVLVPNSPYSTMPM